MQHAAGRFYRTLASQDHCDAEPVGEEVAGPDIWAQHGSIC